MTKAIIVLIVAMLFIGATAAGCYATVLLIEGFHAKWIAIAAIVVVIFSSMIRTLLIEQMQVPHKLATLLAYMPMVFSIVVVSALSIFADNIVGALGAVAIFGLFFFIVIKINGGKIKGSE